MFSFKPNIALSCRGAVSLLSMIIVYLFFYLSLLGILSVFILNPLLIMILYLWKRRSSDRIMSESNLSISFITIVRHAEEVLHSKIKNLTSLKFPSDKYEIIIFLDGADASTLEKLNKFSDKHLVLGSNPVHEGKNHAINQAVHLAHGDLLIFSDGDTDLSSNAIIDLVKHFSDPLVGGVCGQKTIYKTGEKIQKFESIHVAFDNFIKQLESHLGSISSNDGTLFAVRRELFETIPLDVTDDLYICLSVVRKKHQFLFEPKAKASLKTPSRNPQHEVSRRRRIVNRSLSGIWRSREILNPFQYGSFAIRLLVNKVLRRLLPILFIFLFLSGLVLKDCGWLFALIFYIQLFFYLAVLVYALIQEHWFQPKWLVKIVSMVYFLYLGSYGTMLGLVDFCKGKRVSKWEPYSDIINKEQG